MFLMPFQTKPLDNPARNRHTHADIEILTVHRGNGLQLTPLGEEPCGVGDVFLYPIGCPHLSATDANQSFACSVINFLPSDLPAEAAVLLGRLVEHVGEGGRLSIRPSTGQRVATLLRRAVTEWLTASIGSRCATQALVVEALVAMVRDAERTEPTAAVTTAAGAQHVAQARRWMEDYWMSPIRIADLVALGPLGRSQFLARFRQMSGHTVGEELLAIRLREARRMMREGRGSLLDIALACGFGSQSHFNHRFRQALGSSPREWLAANTAN